MEALCSHSVYVLQQLQEQRILGLLCDCMLVVKGVCFKAHKNVLAAFSVYFRSLFQNSPAQKNDVFHLSIQDVGGIGQVLDYMYTSHLELNHDNVHALMEIANSLQVCNILNMCQAFLKPSISNSCSLSSDVRADQETVPGPSVSSEANENLDAVATHDKLRNFCSRQEATVEPLPDSTHQLQPKKAVYLKKFNYLRTHLSEEEDEQQRCTGAVCVPQTPEPTNHSADTLTSDPAETEISDPVELSEMKTAVAEETIPDVSSKVSTGHKYCCEICGKTCKHPSNMELHRRSHTGEKPFQCNVCGKSFSQAGNLQTHLRRHSGDKPYICELCGKSFAAAGDVQRHVIVHSGVRPHLCDLCGRGFSSFSNLKEHRRTHSTERDFGCHCGKSFNTHRKLLKHTHTHSGEKPYSCLTCGRSFAGSGDLQRHKRTHTGERPYTCDACGKSFSRSAVLRRHCRSHCRRTQDRPMTEKNVTAATH